MSNGRNPWACCPMKWSFPFEGLRRRPANRPASIGVESVLRCACLKCQARRVTCHKCLGLCRVVRDMEETCEVESRCFEPLPESLIGCKSRPLHPTRDQQEDQVDRWVCALHALGGRQRIERKPYQSCLDEIRAQHDIFHCCL